MDEDGTNFAQWAEILRFFYCGAGVYGAFLLFASLLDAATTTLFSRPLVSRRFSDEPAFNIRHAVQSFYRDTSLFYYVSVFRLVLNLTITALYVIATYKRTVSLTMHYATITIGALLSADIVASIGSSDSALAYTLTTSVFFQAISLPSLFLASGDNAYLNFAFLRAFAVYDGYRAINMRIGFSVDKPGTSFAVGLFAKAITLMYILAAGVQMLEIPGDVLSDSFATSWEPLGDWHFFNAIYFVAVTLTTVGYGDFSPATALGRLFVIFMIILGVIVFADTASHIVDHVLRGDGGGNFVKRRNSRHVVVTGNPQLSDLIRFTSEFYAKNRLSNALAKVVVLVEKPSWSQAEWNHNLARNEFLKKRIVPLTGSVRTAEDLRRAQVQTADAIFILSTPANSTVPSVVDTSNVMDILAIRNLRTDIPIYTTVLLKSSLAQMRIAQSTPSDLHDPELLFRPRMHENAQYRGLYAAMADSGLKGSFWSPVAGAIGAQKAGGEIVLGGVPHVVEVTTSGGGEKEKGADRLGEICEDGEDARLDWVQAGLDGGWMDLKRSSSICLQDMHAALMAAHIRANGVGTLVTNMVLDIVPRSSAHEPAWLTEYHMGASCDLVHLTIPPQLDGVRVDDVAVMLYDHGLVLLTVAKSGNDCERTLLLNTSSRLRGGDVGMFLTYHCERYAHPALTLVALKFEADQSALGEGHADDHEDYMVSRRSSQSRPRKSMPSTSPPPKRKSKSKDSAGVSFVDSRDKTDDEPAAKAGAAAAPSAGDSARVSLVEFTDTATSIAAPVPAPVSGEMSLNLANVSESGRGPGGKSGSGAMPITLRSPPNVLPVNDAINAADNSSGSSSGSDDGGEDGLLENDERSNIPYFPEEKNDGSQARTAAWDPSESGLYLGIDLFDPLLDLPLLTKRSDGYIPDSISRHIIIAIEGESALQNMPLLAKYLWRTRIQKKKEPGQAPRPKRPKIPLIVVCPNMTEKFRDSFSAYDGKCIFFIDDQLSSRATWRRAKLKSARGVVMLADYGLPWEESDARTLFSLMTLDTFIKAEADVFIVAELVEEKSLEFLREPLRPRRVGVGYGEDVDAEPPKSPELPNRNSNARTPSAVPSNGPPDLRERMSNFAQMFGARGNDRPGTSSGGGQKREESQSRKEKLDRNGSGSGGGLPRPTNVDPPISSTIYVDAGLSSAAGGDSVSDAAEHSDMFRTRRGVLLSRSRYASGDLLLPSASLTLLVREYLEPGFVNFYTNLLGAGNHGSLKIRLVRVPCSLFDASVSVSTVGGDRFMLYRELFVRLMRLGATPLGLYRSGLAPARIPTRKRANRGPALETEAVEFVQNNPCSLHRKDDDPRERASVVSSVLQSTKQVFSSMNPLSFKQRQVDNEWNIGHGSVYINNSEDGPETDESLEAASSDEPGSPDSPHRIPDRPATPRTSLDHPSGVSGGAGLPQPPSSAMKDWKSPKSRRVPNLTGATDASSLSDAPKTSTMSKLWGAASTRTRKIRGDAGDSPGSFVESSVVDNKLPYVMTMPEPYTLVSERDGVYILCDGDFELPRTWGEGYLSAESDGNSALDSW